MKGGSILNILGTGSGQTHTQRTSFTRPKRPDRPTSGSYNFTDLAQIVCNVKKTAYDESEEGKKLLFLCRKFFVGIEMHIFQLN